MPGVAAGEELLWVPRLIAYWAVLAHHILLLFGFIHRSFQGPVSLIVALSRTFCSCAAPQATRANAGSLPCQRQRQPIRCA